MKLLLNTILIGLLVVLGVELQQSIAVHQTNSLNRYFDCANKQLQQENDRIINMLKQQVSLHQKGYFDQPKKHIVELYSQQPDSLFFKVQQKDFRSSIQTIHIPKSNLANPSIKSKKFRMLLKMNISLVTILEQYLSGTSCFWGAFGIFHPSSENGIYVGNLLYRQLDDYVIFFANNQLIEPYQIITLPRTDTLKLSVNYYRFHQHLDYSVDTLQIPSEILILKNGQYRKIN